MKRRTVKSILLIEFLFIAFICGRFSIQDNQPWKMNTNEKQIGALANHYIESSSYSKQGLINTLCEYEHTDRSTAEAVVDDMNVDWQKEANEEIDAYLRMSGFTEGELREYLKRDLFSEKQITKALVTNDIDWSEQAKRRAETLAEAGVSEQNIPAHLKTQGFRSDDIEKALLNSK